MSTTNYPAAPGFKERSGTSEEAAKSMEQSAPLIKGKVLASLLDVGPGTTDEVAERLGLSVLSVRPRFTELLRDNMVEKSSRKRRNVSGRMAAVWRVHRTSSAERNSAPATWAGEDITGGII